MEKKIEDYLHLYLGCECMADGKKGTIEGVSTSNAGCSGNNPLIYFDDGEVSTGEIDIEEIKPILRKISSVTDNEWDEIEDAINVLIDARGYEMLKNSFTIDTSDHRCGWKLVNDAINELRKRSIDVDDLIESGIAIDHSTINH